MGSEMCIRDSPGRPLQSGPPGERIMDSWQKCLRDGIPPIFVFHLNNPPAKDVLTAHLLAKYWETEAILHQPFVRQILELNFEGRALTPASNDPRSDPIRIWYATRGINALIKSSRAFHGLQGQHIGTNIFGTAQR